MLQAPVEIVTSLVLTSAIEISRDEQVAFLFKQNSPKCGSSSIIDVFSPINTVQPPSGFQ